jgi:hypothetical protein
LGFDDGRFLFPATNLYAIRLRHSVFISTSLGGVEYRENGQVVPLNDFAPARHPSSTLWEVLEEIVQRVERLEMFRWQRIEIFEESSKNLQPPVYPVIHFVLVSRLYQRDHLGQSGDGYARDLSLARTE